MPIRSVVINITSTIRILSPAIDTTDDGGGGYDDSDSSDDVTQARARARERRAKSVFFRRGLAVCELSIVPFIKGLFNSTQVDITPLSKRQYRAISDQRVSLERDDQSIFQLGRRERQMDILPTGRGRQEGDSGGFDLSGHRYF